jgi:hypothetical protein
VVARKKVLSKTSATKKSPVGKPASKKTRASRVELEPVVTIDRRTHRERRDSTERRDSAERRESAEHRTTAAPAVAERHVLERRAKVNRRRQIDPTTCERDYTPDEIEFMAAIDEYKRQNGRMFPTCSEVLEVLRKLGYEKRPVAEIPPAAPIAAPIVDMSFSAMPSPVTIG